MRGQIVISHCALESTQGRVIGLIGMFKRELQSFTNDPTAKYYARKKTTMGYKFLWSERSTPPTSKELDYLKKNGWVVMEE